MRIVVTIGNDRDVEVLEQIIEVREGLKSEEYWLTGGFRNRHRAEKTDEVNFFVLYRDAVKKLGADVRKAFAGFEGIK